MPIGVAGYIFVDLAESITMSCGIEVLVNVKRIMR